MSRYDWPPSTDVLVIGPFPIAHDTPGLLGAVADLSGGVTVYEGLQAGSVIFAMWAKMREPWEGLTKPMLVLGAGPATVGDDDRLEVFAKYTFRSDSEGILGVDSRGETIGAPLVLDEPGALWATFLVAEWPGHPDRRCRRRLRPDRDGLMGRRERDLLAGARLRARPAVAGDQRSTESVAPAPLETAAAHRRRDRAVRSEEWAAHDPSRHPLVGA